MMVFFRKGLGKILIWQKFLRRESPTLVFSFIFEEDAQGEKEGS